MKQFFLYSILPDKSAKVIPIPRDSILNHFGGDVKIFHDAVRGRGGGGCKQFRYIPLVKINKTLRLVTNFFYITYKVTVKT